MTSPNGDTTPDESLVETVTDAYRAGNVFDLGRGVDPYTVADEHDISISQARKRLKRLAEAGALERVQGVQPGSGPVNAYEPVEEDTPELRADGGTCRNGIERIDEDPNAVSGDTRIRVESGENDTYVLAREEYGLVKFATGTMGDDESFERYDWKTDERFVLRGQSEAEQFSALLSKEGAFDPNVLFCRQQDWSNDCSAGTATDHSGGEQ